MSFLFRYKEATRHGGDEEGNSFPYVLFDTMRLGVPPRSRRDVGHPLRRVFPLVMVMPFFSEEGYPSLFLT